METCVIPAENSTKSFFIATLYTLNSRSFQKENICRDARLDM
jgi:hypothetical protein